MEHRADKKYCILEGKHSHSTDKYKDLRAIVNKHRQKKKKNFTSKGKRSKEQKALIEKKKQKFVEKEKT